MSQEWTVLKLMLWTAEYFETNEIPQARLDAELLLAHVLECDRMGLYMGFESTVAEEQRTAYRALIRRRVDERIPLAYLVGYREFWSQKFRVTPDVLIPRPETETLVDATIALKPERVLEIGVGSGAITGALAISLPEATFVATDVSALALVIAEENLTALGVQDRVRLIETDLADAVEGKFDLLVSNPPYIRSADLKGLPAEVRNEPLSALDGGEDGLDFYRRLAELRHAPRIAVEVGFDQSAAVERIFRDVGADAVEIKKDLSGNERVVIAEWSAV